MFQPIARAVAQLDDPIFRGVLFKSLGWAAVSFAGLQVAAVWGVHYLFGVDGWVGWIAGVASGVVAAVAAFWLFIPVAVVIGTFYFDRIALAVERRFYPWLPRAESAPLLEQAWDGVIVALHVVALNIVALILAFLVPLAGVPVGWLVSAYAIGRGVFVSVAMRRMPRGAAEALYRQNRTVILAQGAILALVAYVPVLNLLLPVIGTACMVHVLDISLWNAPPGRSSPLRL